MAVAASGNAQLLHHFVVFLRHSIYHPPFSPCLSYPFLSHFLPSSSLSHFIFFPHSFLLFLTSVHLSSVRVSTNLIITISPLSLLGQIEEILPSVSRFFFIFSCHFYFFRRLPRVLAGKVFLLYSSLFLFLFLFLGALKHVVVRKHLDGIKLPLFHSMEFMTDAKIMKIFAESGKFCVFRQR